MNNLRVTTNGLRDDLASINKNVTSLANLTALMEKRSIDLATKQDLHKSIATLKSPDSVPATRLSHFASPSVSCSAGNKIETSLYFEISH